MSRLNWPHAEQQEDCSSFWGQQVRRRGHQTESSSVLQDDRIYPSIEVVDPKRTNASPYNSLADTQAQPHEATMSGLLKLWVATHKWVPEPSHMGRENASCKTSLRS